MRATITARFIASKAAQPREKPFDVVDDRLPGFVLRVQPSGVRSYNAQWNRGRKRVSLGKVGDHFTPDEAREMAAKVLGNVANGRDPFHGLTSEPTGPTLGDFIADTYAPRLKAARPRTAAKTLMRLQTLFGPEGAKWYAKSLDEITVDLVETWRTEQLTAGRKPTTVLRNIMALSGVITRAVKTGKLAENVIRRTDPLKIDRTPKVRFLDLEEEQRLREALEARDQDIRAGRDSGNRWRQERGRQLMPAVAGYGDHLTPAVLLSINTGLRRGELLKLTWDNVDLAGRLLTVVGPTAKTEQTRHIPLNAEALSVLKAWRKRGDAGHVFKFSGGFKTAWKALLKRARITRFRWHDLRHHFASRLAQAGVPLNTIRELMGHQSLAMTLRYAHLAPDQKREAVEMLARTRHTKPQTATPDDGKPHSTQVG